MTDHIPTQLELDLIHVYNHLQHMMDADNKAKMVEAIETLRKRGAPDPSTYSLSHISADDPEDLNLKFHLATLEPLKDFVDGAISQEEAIAKVMPIINAVVASAFHNASSLFSGDDSDIFPLTITVDDDV